MANNDDLLIALLNKIDSILTGGDESAPKTQDNYISWCMPGIPFQPEDLQFAVKGISGKDGDETRQLVRNASEFSRVANFVPSSHVIDNDKQKEAFNQNGTVLWDIYNNVLQYSEVASGDLTDKQKEKIEKFRKLFEVKKTVIDIVTDEEKEVTEDGPMIKAYKSKMAAYLDAELVYNSKRLAALNAEDKMSVQDFTLNAGNYRSRVRQAMDDWTTNGYKEDVEKINAFIAQVTQKDLTLLKANLQDKLVKGKMTDPNSGSDFYLSSFYPGNFINSDKGWTKFTFSESSKDTYSKETHQSTSASTGFNFGLWSVGASGGYNKDTNVKKLDSAGFSMEFSITQVPIARPWFSPEFLLNTAWRWKKNIGQKQLSDGNTPPDGQLIAYPTTAIFVKDIKISSNSISTFDQTIASEIKGGGSVGWGPFRIGGSHKQTSNEVTTKYKVKDNTLTVEGMQLIAFKCFPLPKAPNPSPEINNWV